MPDPVLIDTHCHLDFDVFDADRAQVLENCLLHGITDLLVPAVTADTWQRTINVCRADPSTHLALGLHPMFIDQHQPHHLTDLDQALRDHSPIAVGEIGLDFYHKDLDREKQILYFTKQLIIAKQHRLPVIIHNRKAHDEAIALLKETSVCGGIIHAFNGSIQQADKYIEMGMMLGFGGMLTHARSSKLRGLAKHIALQHIVLETDAPDMTVAQHKGQRNSPEYLHYVAQALADVRQDSVQNVIETTTQNARRVLGIS
jgi:TatD DNase family protein